MTNNEIIFRMASSLEDLIKVIFVRGCVFVEEGGVAYSEEFDGGEQSAIHFLGLAGGDPFGAARVRQVDGASRIDRICVRQAYRGKGLGDRLLTYVLASLDDMGFSQVSFLAEGMLVQWLRNHDFTIARKIKRVDDSEYFEMFRAVSSKPIQTQVQENTALFSEPQHLAEAPLAVSAQPGSERTCVLSHTPFEVTEDDLVYYRKLGVPSPTLCPEERARRRMAFANQRNLFVRKCAATGKRIITNYPPEAHAPVYEIMYWLSDAWDKFASGRKYDFNRPFFEQFGDLMRVAPRPNLQKAAALDENSDYTNYAGENKNCYLIFDSDKSRDCCHSYSINSCVDVIDCFRVEKSELCYECIDSTNCYNSVYLQNCDTCSDSVLLKNCIGCTSCFACINQRNKSYCFMNEQLSKEQYAERLCGVGLNRHSRFQNLRKQFIDQTLSFAHKALEGVHNENVLGDYLTNCKNAFYCFDSRNLWDCKYVIQAFDDAKDCRDCTEVGYHAELLYECCYVGYSAHSNRFCSHALGNNSNLTYCYYCPYCSDCFGCVGLHHAKYCILNQQYTEQEYRELLPRIIAHMQQTGEWGEFFPPFVSPFPYNLTHAHEFYPLSKAEALSRGYCWRDEETKEYQKSTYRIPDAIDDVSDDILNAVLACEVTGKNYKLQRSELMFYRKMHVPVPRLCPDERHRQRLRLRNGRKLYQRKCAGGGEEIISTIPPDKPCAVFCEADFLKQVD